MSTRRAFLASLVMLAAAGTLPGSPLTAETVEKPQRVRLVKWDNRQAIYSEDGKTLLGVKHVFGCRLEAM